MKTVTYKLELGRLIKNTVIKTLKSEAYSDDILCEVFDYGGLFKSQVHFIFKSDNVERLTSFENDVDSYLNRICRS